MICLKKYKADVKCGYGDDCKEMTIEFWAADESEIDNINGGLIPDLTDNDKNIYMRKIKDIFSSTIPSMIADEINRYFSGYIYIQVWYD